MGGAPTLHKVFSLAHIETSGDNQADQGLRPIGCQQGAPVPRRQATILEHFLDSRRQVQQPERVGDMASAFPEFSSQALLFMAKVCHQPLIALREFEIVAGERRWRGTKRVGLSRIPAIVLNLSDLQALELGLLENVQREDLTALELAKGYQRLMSDFGHNQESLARKLGKSRSHIANTLRLLNLPPRIQEMLQDGRLSAGHGRALLTAERPEALASLIVARGLNVRQTEDLVQRRSATHAQPEIAIKALSSEPAVDPALSALVGHKVTVSYHGQRGMLTIHFRGLEGLSRLVRRLKSTLTSRGEPADFATGTHSKAETRRTRYNQEVGIDPSGKENSAAVRNYLRELSTGNDLSRPIHWNEKAYGPKPEPLPKKPSAHSVSDSPPKATTPVRAD